MFRSGFILVCLVIWGCNGGKQEKKESNGFNYKEFSNLFQSATLPYMLTDVDLSKMKDTAQIRSAAFAKFISDSLKNKLFTKGAKIKYSPLIKISLPGAETYFLVKATSDTKKNVLLVTFTNKGEYAATFPFLVPDEDAATTQNSSIDKSFTISRNIQRKKPSGVVSDGKDVYMYNSDLNKFTLIMTDILDDKNLELVNPIDTLAHVRKFSGDYVQGKRNIISIRDGKNANQALAFVHLEKNDGECIGELKGEIFFTTPETAVYRLGGDPCVLQFSFTPTAVTIKEERGCGNYRGLDCLLEGTFPKKKEARPKATPKGKK